MMSRKSQFELFYRYFETENERYESITNRATIFLSVISGLSILAGVNEEEIYKVIFTHWITISLTGASCIFILSSIIGTLLSLRVYPYKEICSIKEIVIKIDTEELQEEDVYSILLANLADAVETNRMINTKRANYLKWSSYLLCLAVISYIVNSIAVVNLFL